MVLTYEDKSEIGLYCFWIGMRMLECKGKKLGKKKKPITNENKVCLFILS